MDPIIAAIISAVGGFLASQNAPVPFQPRVSYSGTVMDPVATLANAQAHAEPVYDTLYSRMQAPITLPDATVQDLPTFVGGGLPMPIGVSGRAGSLASPDALMSNGMWSQSGGFNTRNAGSPFSRVTVADPGNPVARGPQDDTGPVSGTPGGSGGPNPGATRRPFAASSSFSRGLSDASGSGGGNPTSAALQLLYHAIGSGGGAQQMV